VSAVVPPPADGVTVVGVLVLLIDPHPLAGPGPKRGHAILQRKART